MKFQILTCVRPGEARGALRSEINLDTATWRIPPERMKMRRVHEVPLSRQALQVLDEIWSFSDDTDIIFPSIRTKFQQLSENAMNSALRRMGYTKDEVTSHGFRVTASTILNSRGFNPDIIEAVLAHQDPNSVRRAYNRSTYWPQRIKLMQEMGRFIRRFSPPLNRRSDNVFSFAQNHALIDFWKPKWLLTEVHVCSPLSAILRQLRASLFATHFVI